MRARGEGGGTGGDLHHPYLGGVARQGEIYTIIGMDAKGLFWKVTGPRGTGWVVAGFVTPIGYLSEVPVLES